MLQVVVDCVGCFVCFRLFTSGCRLFGLFHVSSGRGDSSSCFKLFSFLAFRLSCLCCLAAFATSRWFIFFGVLLSVVHFLMLAGYVRMCMGGMLMVAHIFLYDLEPHVNHSHDHGWCRCTSRTGYRCAVHMSG